MFLSIHDEIGKDSSNRSIGRLISAISKYCDFYLRKELKEYSLVGTHCQILWVINENKVVTQDFLASLFEVDKAHMSRSLQNLLDKGFIIKHINPDDKRSYHVSLTEDGKQICAKTKELLSEFSISLLDGFSEDETSEVFGYLDRIFMNIFSLCNKFEGMPRD